MFAGQDIRGSVTQMRRHNTNQKRLHPTRWLLAMSFLLFLPGIAAAQSLNGYSDTSGDLDGLESCNGLEGESHLPEASGEAHYSTSGNVNDNAGWQSSGSAYVQSPDLPDASVSLDEHLDAAPVEHGLGGDVSLSDDGLQYSTESCTSADISEEKDKIQETIEEVRAQAEALIESAKETSAEVKAEVKATATATAEATLDFTAQVKAQVEASAEASYDIASSFGAQVVAMIEASASGAMETVSSFFVEAYASAHGSIDASF